jgi:hypothetical protein
VIRLRGELHNSCYGHWTHVMVIGVARSEPDGTRRRTGGEVKGKDANGVGSQQPCTVCWKSVTTNNKNMRQAG